MHWKWFYQLIFSGYSGESERRALNLLTQGEDVLTGGSACRFLEVDHPWNSLDSPAVYMGEEGWRESPDILISIPYFFECLQKAYELAIEKGELQENIVNERLTKMSEVFALKFPDAKDFPPTEVAEYSD